MLFEGKIRVKATIQKLWDTLMEAETLRECIPGAEKIEQLDERTYDCVIKQKVGPISVRFKFKNELVELNPPTHVEMQGKGEDIGKAGHVSQRTTIDLKEVEGGEVEIAYQSNVTIVGKLAMFGDRIMKAKAKKVEADFTNALQEKLRSLE